jgi:hypothetical protein
METISVQIPARARGGNPRLLTCVRGALNARQLQVLDQLPRTRKGDMPVLRGPAKTSKVPTFLVEVGAGKQAVADFEFDVPDAVIDEDLPGLLEMWGAKLAERRQQVQQRAAKRVAKAQCAGEAVTKPRRDAKKRQVKAAAGVASAEVQSPAAGEALTQEHLAGVYQVLPRLKSIELEPVPGPDSMVLGAKLWSATVQIETFGAAGLTIKRIDAALEQTFGSNWCDTEQVEDIGGRLAQVVADAQAAHTEFLGWCEQALLKPASAPDETLDSKDHPKRRKKTAPLIFGLIPLADLARQMFVDLWTAQHSVAQIRGESEAYPDWATKFADEVQHLLPEILAAMQGNELASRLAVLSKWSTVLGKVEVTPQMSLWTADEQRMLQRAIEPQVRRAHQWLQVCTKTPVEGAAAVAVLLLTG